MPRFNILCNDKAVNDTLNKNFSSLKISEEIGGYSDSLTLDIADSESNLAIPSTGAELKVSIGIDDNLTAMGLYIVDEVSLSSSPSLLSITARSAPFRRSSAYKAMQSQKTRHFEKITIASLAETIAQEHGLKASIAPKFKNIVLPHVTQQAESNLNLLKRLTDDLHARVKVSDGKLVIVDLQSSLNHRGRELPRLSLTPQDVSRWRATLAGRTNYKSVIASYRDISANKTFEVKAGKGEPVRRLGNLYDDKAGATRAARARLIADSTGQGTINISMLPRPALKAATLITLNNFREGINGEWQCTSVEHTLSTQGFTTQITASTRNRYV